MGPQLLSTGLCWAPLSKLVKMLNLDCLDAQSPGGLPDGQTLTLRSLGKWISSAYLFYPLLVKLCLSEIRQYSI